jgi:DNA-3-methyladenine glycosylase
MPADSDPLPRAFYDRPVQVVAPALLGCVLMHNIGTTPRAGRIVEVEAYDGPGDPGSHAARVNARAGRASLMFGEPGIAYVYFTYGMHFCLNAVTGPRDEAGAVLIRALEPLTGIDQMRAAGGPAALPASRLASGPGRVCRALAVAREHHGADLVDGALRIVPGRRRGRIMHSRRIGLSADDGREWRFYLASPSTSALRGSRRPSTRSSRSSPA